MRTVWLGWVLGAVVLLAGGGALAADFAATPVSESPGALAGVGFGVGLATLALGWIARLMQGPAPAE